MQTLLRPPCQLDMELQMAATHPIGVVHRLLETIRVYARKRLSELVIKHSIKLAVGSRS